MKEKILDSVGRIDDDMIEEVDELRQQKKSNVWHKYAAIAAAVCIAVAAAIILLPGLIGQKGEDVPVTEETVEFTTLDIAAGIMLEENENMFFYPISFEERQRFGLLPEGAVGLEPENIYRITQADIGEYMGTVGFSPDASLVGKNVYHFASFPDSMAICILDKDGEYEFYCTDGISAFISEGEKSDVLFAMYNLPENCTKIDVADPAGNPLFTVADKETEERIFALLSGCESIGHEASERRFAQLWYDTYGNDNVYYSEEDEVCVYRDDGVRPEVKEYTDADGCVITEYVYPEGYVDIYDIAHALWNEGERCLMIETQEGYRLTIDYFPSINVFFSHDGQFDISEEAAAELNEELKGKTNN